MMIDNTHDGLHWIKAYHMYTQFDWHNTLHTEFMYTVRLAWNNAPALHKATNLHNTETAQESAIAWQYKQHLQSTKCMCFMTKLCHRDIE